MTTSGLPQTTPARLPDQEVWESSARESLLRHVPVRASLMSLVGASLVTVGAEPTMANGLCIATEASSLIYAEQTQGCTAIDVIGPVTLNDDFTLTKHLWIRSGGSLHIKKTLTVERPGYIQVAASGVTISGVNAQTSAIVSKAGEPDDRHLILVCGENGNGCNSETTTITGIEISDIRIDGSDQRPALDVSSANLTLSNVHVTRGDEFVSRAGGLGARWSDISIESSLLEANTSSQAGGAISARESSVTISNSSLISNSANGYGGAVYASDSELRLFHSTLAFNSASEGGAIYATSTSELQMSHSLIVGNSASRRHSDIQSRTSVPARLTIDFTISSSEPVARVPISEDTNAPSANKWFRADSVTVFGPSPQLVPNPGFTKTLALQTSTSNPAINSGDPSLTAGVNGETTDQRGQARVQGGRIDIGAYESGIALAGSDSHDETPAPRPVEPLLPSVIPSLALSESTLTCTIGEFSDAPEFVDVTLVVGGVRQETRRIAMPATTVTWPVDSLWRGQSVGCEVVARVENRVATAYAPGISIPLATTPSPTPTPTPTTPTTTTPAQPARGFAASSIRFSPLSWALDAADRRAIASLVEQAGTDATFRVTGYVQAVGSTRNDRALSRARAQAVAAELRRLGVAAANITAIGGGRSQRDGAAARRATITARWTR